MKGLISATALILVFIALNYGVLAEVPQVEWNRTYYSDSIFNPSYATAIAVDMNGNVYVTGKSYVNYMNGPNYDYLTIKYSADGNQSWLQTYGSFCNGPQCNDIPTGIATDASGNVYITGNSGTVKYDTNGNYLGYMNIAGEAAFDKMGNIYETDGYNIQKFDSNGSVLWSKSFGGGTFEQATGIAVDNDGNAYVTGYFEKDSSATPPLKHQARTVKYDSNGNYLGGPVYACDNCMATGIAVDSMGDFFVVGGLQKSPDVWDYFTVKYDINGNMLWNRTSDQGMASAVAVDIFGNSYVTGSGYIQGTIKYDANGNQIWNTTFYDFIDPSHAAAIAVGFGNIYVTGDYDGYPTEQYYTVKYKDACMPIIVNTSWSDWSNVENCTVQDEQNQSRYMIQYDAEYNTNSCGLFQNQTFYEYRNQQCDFCTPNWTAASVCNPDDSLTVWYNDSNSCFSETNLSSDLQGRQDNQTISFSCDFNKDGFIGDISDINSSINLSLENSSGILGFEDENNKTLFEFNSSNVIVNFANLSIEKQSNNSSFSYLIIKGLDLTSANQTKTAYIDRILNGTGICVKDSELTSISEISNSCKGANEFWLKCPGSNGNYLCNLTNNDTTYRISGLTHSGVQEQATYCGDGVCNGGETCSSCPTDCGACPVSPPSSQPAGGGGGGGGLAHVCTENWTCANWSDCTNNSQIRNCTDLNRCGTFKNKPAENQSCNLAVEETSLCVPNTKKCSGDELMVCSQDGAAWTLSEVCHYGCSNNACIQSPINQQNVTGSKAESTQTTTGMLTATEATTAGIIGVIVILCGILLYWRIKKKR